MAPRAALGMPKITSEQLRELPIEKQKLYRWKRARLSVDEMTARYNSSREKPVTRHAVKSATFRLIKQLVADYGENQESSSEDDSDTDLEDKDGNSQSSQKRTAFTPLEDSGKANKARKTGKFQSPRSAVGESPRAKMDQLSRRMIPSSPAQTSKATPTIAETSEQGRLEDVQDKSLEIIDMNTPDFNETLATPPRPLTRVASERYSPVAPSMSLLTASPQLQFSHNDQDTNAAINVSEDILTDSASHPSGQSQSPSVTVNKKQVGAKNANRKASTMFTTTDKSSRTAKATEFKDEEEHWEFVRKHKSLINQEFDIAPVKMREALEDIKTKSDTIFRSTVRHLDSNEHIETHYARIAQHLTLLAPALVEMITGSISAAGFVNILDPSFGRSRYAINHILSATFWGILTLRVFKRDLLQEFKVPGSYTMDSLFHRDLENLHADLDAKGDRQAVMFRYIWRESRNLYLKKPAFLCQVDKHSESVLQEIENVLGNFFPLEQRHFPGPQRQKLLDMIGEAIDVKCRGDLSHFKCVWSWPKSGEIFDEEVMDVLVSPCNPGDVQLPFRMTNRVRFAFGPTLICQRPIDKNDAEGLETWETDRRCAQKSDGTGLGVAWQRNKATYKSSVIMLDGPLHEAGPEWTKN